MAPAAVTHLAVGAMLKELKFTVAALVPIIALGEDHDETRNTHLGRLTKSLRHGCPMQHAAHYFGSRQAQFEKPPCSVSINFAPFRPTDTLRKPSVSLRS